MRWLLAPLILAASAPAAAQTSFIGGDFAIDWHTPGDLACTRPDDDCDPMNRAECGDTTTQGREIELTLDTPNGTGINLPLTGGDLYVWIEQESSADAECAFDGGSGEKQIGQALALSTFQGGPLVTEPLQFPADIDDTMVITVAEIMSGTGEVASSVVPDACGAAGIEETYRLCFGVDTVSSTMTGGPDGKVDPGTLGEASGWIRFVVDTVPPPDVTAASAEAGEGVLRIRPTVAADTDSTDRWKVILRPVAGDTLPDGSGCRDWTGAGIIVDDDSLASDATVTVGATNWVTYEGCVMVVDRVGNEGEPAPFSGMPVDECDFIECFPGDGLEGGYCGAVAPGSLAGALALLLLRRARRKDRAS